MTTQCIQTDVNDPSLIDLVYLKFKDVEQRERIFKRLQELNGQNGYSSPNRKQFDEMSIPRVQQELIVALRVAANVTEYSDKDRAIHPLPILKSTGSVKGDVKKVLEYRKSHVHPRGAQQAYLSLKGKR